jgi:hypothetical protein
VVRPRHPNKELESLLRSLERQGWRVGKPSKYYKCFCPCRAPLHKRMVRLTPSNPGYLRQLMGWLSTNTCWEDDR